MGSLGEVEKALSLAERVPHQSSRIKHSRAAAFRAAERCDVKGELLGVLRSDGRYVVYIVEEGGRVKGSLQPVVQWAPPAMRYDWAHGVSDGSVALATAMLYYLVPGPLPYRAALAALLAEHVLGTLPEKGWRLEVAALQRWLSEALDLIASQEGGVQ